MRRALGLARRAEEQGEVPVGAVLVVDGELLAEGWNRSVADHDPSAHAEMMALRAAAKRCTNHRLPGTTLFVTLEPCVMCAGAIVQARVHRVVFGAHDPKAGAAGSVYDILVGRRLNHHPICDGGLLAEESADLLQAFFRRRRAGCGCDDRTAATRPTGNGR